MQTIIVGCGRVGAGLAEALSRSGQDVTVIDVSAQSFNRLNADFPGRRSAATEPTRTSCAGSAPRPPTTSSR